MDKKCHFQTDGSLFSVTLPVLQMADT